MGNDFDPDGDGFSVVAVHEPAHGTITGFGPAISTISPDSGFSGTDTVTYKLRDSHGLLATGQVTVWVDTGCRRSANPRPDVDYFVVYSGFQCRVHGGGSVGQRP